MSSADLWDKTLEYISRDLKRSAFETWIKPLRPVDQKEDAIVLEVGSSFQKEFVETHYADPLRKILKRLTNRDISVLFTIGQKNAPLPPAAPTPALPRTTALPLPSVSALPELNKSFLDRYTFDTFVTGDANRLAFTAAFNVARNPGKIYNPLFLFGKKGLGKTHLLQAIGNHINAEKTPFIVRYASVDEFGNDITMAIQKKDFDGFLRKYRNNDVLLVDDINLLEGKDGFQNFFLHTFNALYLAGKQIVITSDRPPRELRNVQPRLMNRFEQGLITEIRSPDLATRQNILRTLSHRAGLPLSSHFVQYVASRITSDVRELEGAVNRLVLEYRLDNIELDQKSIDRALAVYFNRQPERENSLETVVVKTAEHYRIKTEDMTGPRKDAGLVLPRQIAMYIAYERKSASVVEIALRLNRSHSAVIHGHKKITESLTRDINIKNAVDSITANLNEGF